MDNPKVSVITITFNLENYISQCIESVITQTYENWEMLIIDDHSTDSTYTKIQKYAKTDKRIHAIRHGSRWGVNKLVYTYNQALKKSTGDLIAILEGDDFWPKDKLEKQIPCFYDKRVVLAYGDQVATKENGKPIQIIEYKKNDRILSNNPPGSILYGYLDFHFYLAAVTVMVRKESLLQIGGFINKDYPSFVDFPTWFALSTKGLFCYKKMILGYYRKHKGSFWFAMAEKSKAMGKHEIQKCLINFVEKNKKILRRNGVILNEKKIRDYQQDYIEKKQKNKKLSILLHYLAFNETEKAEDLTNEIMKDKSYTLIYKFIAIFIFLTIKLNIDLLHIIYILQHQKYKIEHLIKRYEYIT